MNSHTQTQSKKEWHADAGLLTDEARKALRCLYLQVPETVARDVAQRVEAAFTGMQAEIDRLHDLIALAARTWMALDPGVPWEGGIDGAMRAAIDEIDRLRGALAGEQAGRRVAVEALREIAVWTQELQDGADRDLAIAQWRGCVAIARAAIEREEAK